MHTQKVLVKFCFAKIDQKIDLLDLLVVRCGIGIILAIILSNRSYCGLLIFPDNTDSHWLNSMGSKGNLKVNSLCNPLHKPVTGLDIDKTLLFGCDNEAVYFTY